MGQKLTKSVIYSEKTFQRIFPTSAQTRGELTKTQGGPTAVQFKCLAVWRWTCPVASADRLFHHATAFPQRCEKCGFAEGTLAYKSSTFHSAGLRNRWPEFEQKGLQKKRGLDFKRQVTAARRLAPPQVSNSSLKIRT